jgi:hypothetical protein
MDGLLPPGEYGRSPSGLKTFGQALCESVGCAPERYLQVAFNYCLYPRPRALSRLFMLLVSPVDIQLLKDAGEVTTKEEFNELLNDYRQDLQRKHGFLATHLKFRISTTRLEQLFNRVMRAETESSEN